MSNVEELELALSDVFASFDVVVDGETAEEVEAADVREIRANLASLAGSRPSGN